MRRDRIGIRQDKRTVRRECRWIVADRRTCTVSRGELVPAGRVCLYGFKGSELLRFGSHDRPRQQAEHGRATTDQACTVTGDTTHSGTIHSSLAESPPRRCICFSLRRPRTRELSPMCSTEPSAAACFVLAAWQLSMMLLMVKSQYRMRSTADAGCWMLDARRAVRQKTGVAPQSTHHHLHSDRRSRLHHPRPACKPSQLLQRLLTSCLQSSIAPALDVPLRAHQHLGDRCPTNSLIARPTVAVVCTASIVQLLSAAQTLGYVPTLVHVKHLPSLVVPTVTIDCLVNRPRPGPCV